MKARERKGGRERERESYNNYLELLRGTLDIRFCFQFFKQIMNHAIRMLFSKFKPFIKACIFLFFLNLEAFPH